MPSLMPTPPTTDTGQRLELPSLRALLQQVEDEHNRVLAALLSENMELRRRLSCLTSEECEQQKPGSSHGDAEMATASVLGIDSWVVRSGPPDHCRRGSRLHTLGTASHDLESIFKEIDRLEKGRVDASDIENATKRGKSDLPSDMLTRIQKMIEAVHMTMQEPEECPPEELSFQGFKFIMLVDNPEETLGDRIGETVRLVRKGCLEKEMISLIERSLDIRQLGYWGTHPVERKWLEPILACVILANALCIGMSEDIDREHNFWKVMELLFTLFFVLELFMKLKEEGVGEHFFGVDFAWSWFDFIIVLIAAADSVLILIDLLIDVGDTIDLSKFTIVRLMRLVKVLRFELFKELTMMITGVIGGMRTLFWAFVLLLLLVYILGVLMRQVTRDVAECGPLGEGCSHSELHLYEHHERLFGTVFRSMFTVFRCFTDGCSSPDGTPLQVFLWDTHGWIFVCGYMISMLFVIFGVFNLIAAVFVENVLAGAKNDEQKRHLAQHNATLLLGENLQHLIHKIINGDTTRNQVQTASGLSRFFRKPAKLQADSSIESNHVSPSVTKHVFEEVMLDPDVQQTLEDLNVSVYEHGKLFDVLDADGDGELDVSEMVDGILRLRGPLEKGDVVSSALMLRSVQKHISLVDAKITENQQLMERMRTELVYSLRGLKGEASLSDPSPSDTITL